MKEKIKIFKLKFILLYQTFGKVKIQEEGKTDLMKAVQTVERDRTVTCLHQHFSFAYINQAGSFKTLQSQRNCIHQQSMHASKARGGLVTNICGRRSHAWKV